MISAFSSLSSHWNAILPALADHLWQSTLFAIVAALLVVTLRKYSARARYIVWLAASLKFLVPFSLFIALGSRLSFVQSSAAMNSEISFVEEFGRPFTQSLPQAHSTIAAHSGHVFHWQLLLLLTWLSGSLIVLSIWTRRWWRIFAAQRTAGALSSGREVSVLRDLEHASGFKAGLKLVSCPTALEPGVFGIFRPVLLWPDSVSMHLDDAHLEAVLAHELCHVRRQDNLMAALHMFVESLFWFHPLIWFIGARLIEERELACDEAVIAMGCHRATYAESILKVCEFCLSSPLTCVSGVTGADLKKRMAYIMTGLVVRKLNFSRKLLLWVAACLVLAVPIVYGLLNPAVGRADNALGAAPKFSSVSIKSHPADANGIAGTRIMMSLRNGSFVADGATPQTLVQIAYHIQGSQLAGAPDWMNSAKYDISAKVDKAAQNELNKLGEDQRGATGQEMLQQLLARQFKLKVHQESRDLPVYELVVSEGGSKLQKAGDRGMMHLGTGELISKGTPLALLTEQLSARLGRTVIDKTGLTGNYAYALRWTPSAEEQARVKHDELASPDTRLLDSSAPPLLNAVQEELGLTLQPATEHVQVLVIDHIEQPSQD